MCVLCDELASTGDLVYDGAGAAVVLHGDWAVPGHAMVVAKRHVENVSDLEDEEWRQFSHVWRKAERVLLALTGAERAVVMKLGLQTPHLHVHPYPVSSTMTRAAVFDAIDAKTHAGRDAAFVDACRRALND